LDVAGSQDRIDEPPRRVEQVLSVVEHEEQLLVSEELDDALFERHAGSRDRVQRGSDRAEHRVLIGRGGELAGAPLAAKLLLNISKTLCARASGRVPSAA
jgi:hypothetical protein